MSELQRWSEEGGMPGELSLLDASRAERAPAEARARTLKALGIAAAMTTAATATATTGKLGLLTKIAGVAVLAAGVAAVAYEVRHAASRELPPVSSGRIHEETVASASPPPVDPPVDTAPPVASAPVLAPAHPAPSLRPVGTTSADERLSQEVAALEGAHQALADHQPDAALRALDRYRDRFPRGTLSSDATVLRVQALLARGDRAGAQRLADAYSAAHPDSPYARRLEALVHESSNK